MSYAGKMHLSDRFGMLMTSDLGTPTDYMDNERGKYDLSWLITTTIEWSMKIEELEVPLQRLYTQLYLRMCVFIATSLWHFLYLFVISHDTVG